MWVALAHPLGAIRASAARTRHRPPLRTTPQRRGSLTVHDRLAAGHLGRRRSSGPPDPSRSRSIPQAHRSNHARSSVRSRRRRGTRSSWAGGRPRFARDHTRHVCVDEVSQSSRPRSMPHRPSRCAAPCTQTARQRSARRLQTRRGSRGVRPPWTALRPTSCWAATVSTGSRPCATSPTRLALTRALRDVKKSRCLRVSLASRPRQKDGLRTHAPGFVTDTIRNNVSPCS